MKYFARAQTKKPSLSELVNARVEVDSLTGYARAIYGQSSDEALSKTFHHILDNYDPAEGELNRYAKVVCKTVGRSAWSTAREVSVEDENLIKYADNSTNSHEPSVEDCLDVLAGKVFADLAFFQTGDSSLRKFKYTDIFSQFSTEVVLSAWEEIRTNTDFERILLVQKQRSGVGSYKSNVLADKQGPASRGTAWGLSEDSRQVQKGLEALTVEVAGREFRVTPGGEFVRPEEHLNQVETDLLGHILSKSRCNKFSRKSNEVILPTASPATEVKLYGNCYTLTMRTV